MSFLSKTTPVLRTTFRSSVIRSSPRCFSTTIIQHKSATDSVKDGLKSVDRAVSDAAVSGIDKGGMLAISLSLTVADFPRSRNERQSCRHYWYRKTEGRRNCFSSCWRSQRQSLRIVRTGKGQSGGSQGQDVMRQNRGIRFMLLGIKAGVSSVRYKMCTS